MLRGDKMKKLIILNGPAGVGKDTLAEQISWLSGAKMINNKQPLFDMARAILGAADYGKFLAAYNDRSRKESPQTFLNGVTPRYFFIWLSEDIIKPAFGREYFGNRFLQAVNEAKEELIVADIAFVDEILPALRDGHQVTLYRIHREGVEFGKNDSRNYIFNERNLSTLNFSTDDITVTEGYPKADALRILRNEGLI